MERQRMKDLLLRARVVVRTSKKKNSRRRSADNVKKSCTRTERLQYVQHDYVLIDWVGGPDGKIFGPRSWRTDRAQRGPCTMTEGQIFSRPARPNSVNKHFIIWPPRFSFFPFFFLFFFFFRVTKFGMLLILTEKSGFIQQQSCFSSLLARAIDKIPVWGPYAILAGPDGFFRTCSRHHVRPSYGDFLNSFAMKARAGPYGSYNNIYSHSTNQIIGLWRWRCRRHF